MSPSARPLPWLFAWRPARGRGAASLALGAVLFVGSLVAPASAGANGWEHHAIPRAVLLKALGSDNAALRARAALSIGVKAEPETVEPLLAALERPEQQARVRREIYRALGRIGDPRAASVLARAAREEPREELRAEALAALGAIGAVPSMPAVLEALEDHSLLVRAAAVDALGGFAGEGVAALARIVEKGGPLAMRAVRSLGATRSQAAVEPLLTALERARDDQQRARVVAALGAVGAAEASEAIAHLVETTGNPELRLVAVAALGAIRDGEAAPALMRLLDDPDPRVQRFAAMGLVNRKARAAAPALLASYRRLAEQRAKHREAAREGDAGPWRRDLDTQRHLLRALIELDPAHGLPAFLDAGAVRVPEQDSAGDLALAESAYRLRRLAFVGLGYS